MSIESRSWAAPALSAAGWVGVAGHSPSRPTQRPAGCAPHAIFQVFGVYRVKAVHPKKARADSVGSVWAVLDRRSQGESRLDRVDRV